MDNEELTELEETHSYDAQQVTVELTLWASLVLRGEGVVWDSTNATDVRNERAQRIIEFLCDNANKSIRDQIRVGQALPSARLPDVCGSCFMSYGLTVCGRYRDYCPSCERQESRTAFERLMEMHRICWNSFVNEAVLSQLIYKYYSPNGDSTWELKILNPLE